MSTVALVNKYPLISDQISKPALAVVLDELEKTLTAAIPGEVAEFGCYIGTTSLFIRRLLNEHGSGKKFYAYDSFEGLPPKTVQDASAAGTGFKAGELIASKKQFMQEFKRAGLLPPVTYKAWFGDLATPQLPRQLAFAFLDGDFYDSILASLRLAWPLLAPGGTITIDDYQREALPGVERAVLDFFQGSPPPLRHQYNIAIIPKPVVGK